MVKILSWIDGCLCSPGVLSRVLIDRDVTDTMIFPGRRMLNQLYDLAEDGYFVELSNQLEQILLQNQSFLKYVQELTHTFQRQVICEFLKSSQEMSD